MSIIDGIGRNAKTAKWIGLLLVIAGIVSIFSPLGTGLAFMTVIGALLAFAGLSLLIFAFRAGSFGDGMMEFLVGALTLVVGVWVMATPDVALVTVGLFLAMYFAVTGIVEVIYALRVRPIQGWGWLLFGGVVSVLLGVFMWRQFPLAGAWAVGVLVGIRLLLTGFELMAIGGAAGDVADVLDDAVSG